MASERMIDTSTEAVVMIANALDRGRDGAVEPTRDFVVADLLRALAAERDAARCTGCGSRPIVAVRAVLTGGAACCPDCSTLWFVERNEIRDIVADRLRAAAQEVRDGE